MNGKRTAFLLGFAIMSISAMAQAEGKVVDENGEPLAGATVRWEGTNVATTTDINGLQTQAYQKAHLLRDIQL